MPNRASTPSETLRVARVLELHNAQRELVDEQHDVRAARALAIGDGELVDGQRVVGFGLVEVKASGVVAADVTDQAA